MKQIVKNLLFIVLLLLLLLPFCQRDLKLFQVIGLKGSFTIPKKPHLTFQNYYAAGFQDSLNKYIENTVGMRPDLVRLHNQLQYSLFGKLNANSVIIGKNDYLYELNYIKAVYGLDYVGDEKVAEDVGKTVKVREWLQKKGKDLIVVLAPGKGTYFQEFIPDLYKTDTIGQRNYDSYYRLLRERQIPVIGCNDWFLSIKDTADFELFPKLGIHWGYYGMGLVFDSVLNMMEHQLGRDFVDFRMDNFTLTDDLRSPDCDLWEGLNLFFEWDNYPMMYPDYHFENVVEENKPVVATIADSYYWQWFGNGYALKAFESNDFWYYNQQILPADNSTKRDVKTVSMEEEIEKNDIFLLIQTDANMSRFSFGFIDDVLDFIERDTIAEKLKMEKIREIADDLRTNEKRMEDISIKAKQRNISVEQMLILDAEWIYNHKKTVEQEKRKEIEKIIKNIRESEGMTDLVSKKAKERGISFEEMLQLDAEWIYSNKKSQQ